MTGVVDGRSAALVVHGEAGIGKTALLEHAVERAHECRVLWVSGVESETDLPFGGLHQLCAPFIDQCSELHAPQRAALMTAFGLVAGPPPDPFLIGLALLSLLAHVAEERPLVCVVDDAQWLDPVSAQALAFVARRLEAERVGLFFGVRGAPSPALRDLPRLEVRGLGDADARSLLAAVTSGPVDDRIRERVLAETQGNPLALLELPRDPTIAEVTGAFRRLERSGLTMELEAGFQRRVAAMPESTRDVLLLAATEATGDLAHLERVAAAEGLDLVREFAPAVADGLVDVTHAVRFRHPLVRSAIYAAASQSQRQQAHRRLAESTDQASHPNRYVWHLARATAAPDEDVAEQLEQAADRARSRGSLAATAAFLDRATQLTPDLERRGRRAVSAAEATYRTGAYASALELLDAAELSPLDEATRGRAELLRGLVLFASQGASAGLPRILAAAKRLEPVDPALARETYRDAYYASITAGRLSGTAAVERIAAATVALRPDSPPSRADLLLEGSARLYTDGYEAGVRLVRQALDSYRREPVPDEEGLGWLTLASRMAHNVLDFEAYSDLSARLVHLTRETGALSLLPSALLLQSSNLVFAGEMDAAARLADEAANAGEALGGSFFAQYCALVLEPWRGSEDRTRAVIEAVIGDLALRGAEKASTATAWATAVLCNGLGRHEQALDAARQGAAYPQELGLSIWATTELVEAAVHLGRPGEAAADAERLLEMCQASGTEWALGTAALVAAQLADGSAADEGFGEAVARLERAGVHLQAARARLLHGEWLRRAGRRREARRELGLAHEQLLAMGVVAFAERARREHDATGATLRRSGTVEAALLTPQEAQIARLAAEGLTNPEIGTQLFISPHTVEWHLRKVFAKLGVSSRREIAKALEGRG
ncbi:helix-turn-helix transcriptional regulator [Nocardioides anomalus]|uniref:helix-turn-helix transcriptional regulator n=1 Tax=Nocardioides anomalus TaxID=2712223 RepID=UPI001E42A997|nr:LuxR family transcriptional regulator [Nocardioides anomalus]